VIRIDDEIRALTGARAVAAGAIVLTHLHPVAVYLTPRAAPFVPYMLAGALAVDFFFLLSGFIITHRYLDALSRPAPAATRRFWLLRFARIWPVHAVTVLAFLLYHVLSLHYFGYGMSADNLGVRNLLANLTMLQMVPPFTPINPPSWSLAPETGAYLVFPLLALGLARIRSAWTAFSAAAVVLVAAALVLTHMVQHDVAGSGLYTVSWSRIVFGFTAGCLLAVAWRSLTRHRRAPQWDLALVAAAVAVVGVGWWDVHHRVVVVPMHVYPFLGLVVLACAGSTGPVARLLGSPVIEWAGRISYSVYVTHFLVIAVAFAFLVKNQTGAEGLPVRIALGAAVVVLIGVVGTLMYYVVEEPSRRAIRRLAGRRPTLSVAATSRPS
jgi:peptidoglycan/LPS O-acetylase OafA/YrhL